MSGPPHNFPGNFPMSQQNTNHPMRSQFMGGPQMGSMMGQTQQGMVSPQSYGMGVAMSPNVAAMQQSQQQQQPHQNPQLAQQMQQMQQIKVGPGVSPQGQQPVAQQVAQQVNPSAQAPQPGPNQVAGVNPGGVPGGQDPNQPGAPMQQPRQEINPAALCRYGLEVVQEIVARMAEVFTILKSLQPPNGTPQGAQICLDRKAKIHDLLGIIKNTFKRLGVIYQRCNESAQLQGMEYMHIESLIPLKEEWDHKADERKMSESYRMACEERREIMEQVLLKNKHLKEVIDSMRRIIWEINSMLCMRRS